VRNNLTLFLSLLVIAGMALAGCAQPTQAPAQRTLDHTSVASQPAPVGPTVLVVTATPMPPPEFKSKDPSTYVFADWDGIVLLDPASTYSADDGQIILNTHDTLITYNREDPNSLVPMLALEVSSLENGGISADGLTYTFKIRPGVRFHDGTEMTPGDVAYTFQRGILQGGTTSPQYLLTGPFLGVDIMDITDIITPSLTGPEVTTLNDDPANLANVDPATLEATCKKVTDAIVADDAAGTVTMKLAQPWGPFLATLANSWGAITSKAWISSRGGWDGDCATWQNYYARTSDQLVELGLGNSENGTGPYKLEAWTPGEELVLVANEDYWVEQPLWEGGPSGAPKLKKVIFKLIDDFNIRYAMLEAGEVDDILVGDDTFWPQMDTLVGVECQENTENCQEIDPKKPLQVIKGLQRTIRADMYFTFEINPEDNAFIGSGQLDGKGIPPNFFSDPWVRKGFAYCFNYDTYLNEALLGEGVRSVNIMLPGMLGSDETTPFYTYDPTKCAEMLQQSRWKKNSDGTWTPDPAGDVSLWDTGFRFSALYQPEATFRQVAAEILQAELGAINEKFVIEVTGLPFPVYFENSNAHKIPIFFAAWQEDIHDPHSWVAPINLIYGTRQELPVDIKDKYAEIIKRAVVESDPARRAEIYKEYNNLSYDTASSIPLFVSLGRHYQQRWVRGWYHNPIYPGTYFYPLWKE
jgi:peptide/nickel transport system substrate-binding protein